jgi:hypothetical protein
MIFRQAQGPVDAVSTGQDRYEVRARRSGKPLTVAGRIDRRRRAGHPVADRNSIEQQWSPVRVSGQPTSDDEVGEAREVTRFRHTRAPVSTVGSPVSRRNA